MDFAAAIRQYDRAIQINSGLSWAYISRGNARYHTADRNGFLADFRRAFELDCGEAVRQILRRLERDVELHPQGLLGVWETQLQRDPNDFLAYAAKGLLLLLLGRESEARTDFEEFRRLRPEDFGLLQIVIEHTKLRLAKKRSARDEAFASALSG